MKRVSHHQPSPRSAGRRVFGAVLLAVSGLAWAVSPGFGQPATDKAAPSYGELAGQMLCGPLKEIEAGLNAFDARTLPHEAKELRKQLGRVRNRLDLFAFAYPSGPGKDLFLKLRDDLDKGYERMGEFKDLFDAQRINLAEFDPDKQRWSKGVRPEAVTYPDPARVESRREKVLKWKDKFLEPDRLAAYRTYLCAPDLSRFHERAASDLSRFFWGGPEGIVPLRELSGIDNFRRLAAELLDRARQDYPAVQELRHLEGATAVKFHDFRKRVRSVVKIAADIEILPASNPRAEALGELMDDLDDDYGDVNDIIVDLELAVEAGDTARADRLRSEIESEWRQLRQWQADHQIPAVMQEYRDLLVSLIRPAP